MHHFNKQKLAAAFVFCLLLGAAEVFGCTCVQLSGENLNDAVKDAVKGSAMVFVGKVVGFEHRKGIPNEYLEARKKYLGVDFEYETKVVKFQVEQWWKGEAAAAVVLATSETKSPDGTGSSSSCDYDFTEGETYLVYAYRTGSELRTNDCARTRPLGKTEDLKFLGKGKKPVNEKDESNL